jgi:hypothetical protein
MHMVDLREGCKVFEMKFFSKIRVYKLLIKASLKKALLHAFYSSIIVFLSSLAAQLQSTQQITIITVITAIVTAAVTFLTELRENYPIFKLLMECKVAEKDAERVLRFMRLAFEASRFEGND